MKTFLILLLILFPLMVLADEPVEKNDEPIQLAKADLMLLGIGGGSGGPGAGWWVMMPGGAGFVYLPSSTSKIIIPH